MLAKLALRNASFTAAALAVGDFTLRTIVPTLAFYDFETFFSCNHKPVNWTDTINGMKAINTLSVGWTADQLLSLYTLTKNETWLQQGELVLGVFNLFQQVGTAVRLQNDGSRCAASLTPTARVQVWSPPRYGHRIT